MIEHLALDLSQIEPSEVAASINRTISYSVCYENHSIHSKPLHLNTVADFLVGIKIVSHLSPDLVTDPITVRITVSDIELCQWKMEPQRIYLLGSSIRITETDQLCTHGLLPLLSCGSSIRIHASTPIVIQCMYMTSYSLYVRYLFKRRPIHIVIEKEEGPVTYRMERETIVLMKSPLLPLV
jgi:hypothetical protein